jgi:hypothetical protein
MLVISGRPGTSLCAVVARFDAIEGREIVVIELERHREMSSRSSEIDASGA